jgi:hypothetical protein
MEIVLLQKQTSPEVKDLWEDLAIPVQSAPGPVDFLMKELCEGKAEGHYRTVQKDGTLTKFHVYRREVFEARVEG